jgi:hypothetical protein
MFKRSDRERLLLGVTLAAAALFICDLWIVRPARDAWQGLTNAVAAKGELLARHRRLLADSARIRREFAGALPARVETNVLRELAAVARRNGVRISDLKPQRGEIWFSVEADWESFSRFLYHLQRSPQLPDIRQARVQRRSGDAARVSAQFVITTGAT